MLIFLNKEKFLKSIKNKKQIVIFSRTKDNITLIKNTLKSANISEYLVINVPETLKGKEPCNFMIGFLKKDDILIIYDYSDLGSSFENIFKIFDLMINKINVNKIYCLKYEILINFEENDQKNNFFKILQIIKETEKDIFSFRSKTGINEARQKGKKIGRPKSDKNLPYPLDKYKRTIKRLLKSGYTIKYLAQKYNVTYRQMSYYIHSRKLK